MAATDPSQRAKELIRSVRTSDQLAWWEWSIPDNVVDASPKKIEMLGYDYAHFENAGYEAYTNLLHPDDYERVMEAMRAHLEGRAELYDVDYRIRAKSGEYVWYMDRGAVIDYSANGEPLLLRGIVLNLGPEFHAAAGDDAVVESIRRSLPTSGETDHAVVCAQCGRLGYGIDDWIALGRDVDNGLSGRINHTLCPDCIRLLYPQAAQQILARLRASHRTAVRVALLAPKRLVRELLSCVLGEDDVVELTGAFEVTPAFIAHLRETSVDVGMISAETADSGLVELIKQIHAELPRVNLVGYCLCHHNAFAIRTLRAGARGFVDANASVDELKRAIHAASTGAFYVSDVTAEHVVEDSLRRGGEPHAKLSDREFQIMLLLAQRKTIAEIAATLNVSSSTVSTHRRHVLEKMALESGSELSRYAIEHGLMTWESLL